MDSGISSTFPLDAACTVLLECSFSCLTVVHILRLQTHMKTTRYFTLSTEVWACSWRTVSIASQGCRPSDTWWGGGEDPDSTLAGKLHGKGATQNDARRTVRLVGVLRN